MPITVTLPGISISWDIVVPDIPWTFSEYNVYRRTAVATDPWGNVVPTGVWGRIARIPDVNATTCIDYGVGSGVLYDYAITWWANNGTDELESDKQAIPATESVAWEDDFVHDVADPSYFVPVLANNLSETIRQAQVRRRARGRSKSTTFTSELFEGVYELYPIRETVVSDQHIWQALKTLLLRQFTHTSLLALRLGHSGDVVFGTLAGELSHETSRGISEMSVRFEESHHSEAL